MQIIDNTNKTTLLLFLKMLLVIPFGVTSSTLVLYLTNALHYSDGKAIHLIGFLLASTGLLRIVAGYISDSFLSYRLLIFFSALFLMIGCTLLSYPAHVYLALSFIALGFACTIAINSLVTAFLQSMTRSREALFLRFYSGMNIGYLISFALSSYFEIQQYYNELFLIASGISLFALMIILFNWKNLRFRQTAYQAISQTKTLLGVLFISLIIICIYVLIPITIFNPFYFLILSIIAIILIGLFVIKRSINIDNNKIITCFFFIVPVMIFASIQHLTPMILTLFIERKVSEHYIGIIITPQWMQLINAITIVIAGPLLCVLLKKLKARGISLSLMHLFAAGLLFISLSLFTLVLAILVSTHLINFSWIIISCILQALSELLIIPIGFTIISQLFSLKYQGVMMGNWLLLLSISAIFSSNLSQLNIDFSVLASLLGSLAMITSFMMIFMPYSPFMRE